MSWWGFNGTPPPPRPPAPPPPPPPRPRVHAWVVQREPSALETTMGAFTIDGTRVLWTVEDEIREPPGPRPANVAAWVATWKVPKATAIPSGRYRVVLSFSQRFQRWTPELLDVPGFTGIRLHFGNFATDTEGCLIVGYGRGQAMIAAGTTKGAEADLVARLRASEAAGEPTWMDVRLPAAA